jgi:putrescine aminotransferase
MNAGCRCRSRDDFQKERACIMAKSEQVIKDLDRVIGLINTDMKDIPAEEKKQMVADTIDHFDNYVSPGWLKYRKCGS